MACSQNPFLHPELIQFNLGISRKSFNPFSFSQNIPLHNTAKVLSTLAIHSNDQTSWSSMKLFGEHFNQSKTSNNEDDLFRTAPRKLHIKPYSNLSPNMHKI